MEDLKEVYEDLKNRVEHLEDKGDEDSGNEFHEGFKEGYLFGLQTILDEIEKILE